jgi:taurine transport system permease protein
MVLGTVSLALGLGLWFWITWGDIPEDRIISPAIWPSPGETWDSLSSLLNERDLVGSIAASLKRVFIGFGLAIIVGFTTGVLAAAWRPVQAFFAPIVLFGRSLPIAALIPLTIAWFGIEEKQKIMFIFIATVPFIFSDTVAAVLAVHERYVETAQTLGATRKQIIFKVLVPLSLPDIFTSIRFMFGLAFGYIMLAETVRAKAGIGFLLNQNESRGGLIEHTVLLLLIVGVLAYLIDRTLAWFQKGLFPYRSDL